jgi:zinc protease
MPRIALMLRILPLCLGLLAGCTLTKERPGAAAPELPLPTVDWTQHTLDNGLTLLVHEDPKAPVAGVYVWYRVGSKDESPGRTGFAHLFEHLMFTGTEHFDGEFFEPLIAVGATDMNGTTSTDRTNYYQTVPVRALDRALWLESERMGHFIGAVTEDKLEREKGVVQNEYRQRHDRPYGAMWDHLVKGSYPQGHPYSWPTIGRMEDIAAAELADVREWFDTHYGAANAILVVAGDVEAEAVRERVAHYFGGIEPGPTLHKPQRDIARMQGEKREVMTDRVPQARLLMAWNIPPELAPATNALHLAGDLLASGRASRLHRELVEERELATQVSAGVWGKKLGSQFIVDATAAEGVPLAELEAAVDEILARFKAEGPTPEELQRARVRLYASTIRGLQDVGGSGKADLLARSLALGGSPDAWREQLMQYREATPESVRRTAAEWLDDGRYVLEVRPRGDLAAGEDAADRSRMPEPESEPPALALPELQHMTLSNGLQVALAERSGVPQVEFRLIAGAGYATDPPDLPGRASMAEALRTRGTPDRDAIAISEAADALGADLSTQVTRDHAIIGLSAVRPFLAGSLALFSEVLREPTFPEEELARMKRRREAAIAQEKAQPSGLVSRHLATLLYGEGHPYAQPPSGTGTPESLAVMTRADLQAYQREHIRPDNARLLVTGDIDLATLRPLLERHFGDWQMPATAPPDAPDLSVTERDKGRVFLIDRPGATQSYIAAARIAPPSGDARDVGFDLVNEVLGGKFTARLNQALRVERGWSYGFGSALPEALGPRPFYVYGAVQTDRTADAAAVIRDELAAIRGERPPSPEELDEAARSLTLSLPGEHQTLSQITATLAELLRLDLPEDYFADYVPAVNAAGPEEVAEAADALIAPDAMTWLVVGDRRRVEAELRALGLGALTVLDREGRPIEQTGAAE